jgi:ATP-dependent Clp protease protease subunit
MTSPHLTSPPEVPQPHRTSPWQPDRPPPSAPPIAPSTVVPFPAAETPGGWLQQQLLGRRIVLARGHLGHDLATVVCAQLLTLDAEGDDPAELHLSTPDGDLDAALTVLDAMGVLRITVRALAVGTVGGPALAVFAAAPERLAFPHATFHLTEPALRADGSASEVAAHEAHYRGLLTSLYERIAEATGREVDQIREDARRGTFLTAEDALSCGLATKIHRKA